MCASCDLVLSGLLSAPGATPHKAGVHINWLLSLPLLLVVVAAQLLVDIIRCQEEVEQILQLQEQMMAGVWGGLVL